MEAEKLEEELAESVVVAVGEKHNYDFQINLPGAGGELCL